MTTAEVTIPLSIADLQIAERENSPSAILGTVSDLPTFLEIVGQVMGTTDWDEIANQLSTIDCELVVQCFNVRFRRIKLIFRQMN